MAEKKAILNEDNIMRALDYLYEKTLNGIPKLSVPIGKLASDYLEKDADVKAAIKKMQKNQIAKCTTSGVITGFGGAITLPVTIPANISSVLYMQMRMIACTAYMAGYNLSSDQVQTFVYACLAGVSISTVVKKFGTKTGEKLAIKTIDKIPGKVLTQINQKVGFRLVTKFGEKGLLNLVKLVPVVGAGINGTIDFAETRVIANRAYKMFVDGDFSFEDEPNLKEKGIKAYHKAKEAVIDAEFKEINTNNSQKTKITRQTVTKAASRKKDVTVYVTASGKSYHTDITHAGKKPIKISLSNAKEKGYLPCKRCVKE